MLPPPPPGFGSVATTQELDQGRQADQNEGWLPGTPWAWRHPTWAGGAQVAAASSPSSDIAVSPRCPCSGHSKVLSAVFLRGSLWHDTGPWPPGPQPPPTPRPRSVSHFALLLSWPVWVAGSSFSLVRTSRGFRPHGPHACVDGRAPAP